MFLAPGSVGRIGDPNAPNKGVAPRELEITVNNPGSTLTDYQVRIPLTLRSGMHADFGNLRFTTEGGDPLSHWPFARSYGVSATFDVKVPSLPTGDTVILATWENADDTPIWSADDTYVLADTFNLPRAGGSRFGVLTSIEGHVDKFIEAVTQYQVEDIDVLFVVGDSPNGNTGTTAGSLAVYQQLRAAADRLGKPVIFCRGNHDYDYLTEAQIADLTGNADHGTATYNGVKYIWISACYRSDSDSDPYSNGNFDFEVCYVPPSHRQFLADELDTASGPVVLLVEQFLRPIAGQPESYEITNSDDVWAILTSSEKDITVFHGHSGLNDTTTVDGITLYTLRAMDYAADNASNAFAEVIVQADATCRIMGFGEQLRYNTSNAFDADKWGVDNAAQSSFNGGQLIVTGVGGAWRGLVSVDTFNAGRLEFRVYNNFINGAAVGFVEPAMSGTGRDGILLATNGTEEIRKYVANTATQYNANYPSTPFKATINWSGSNAEVSYDDGSTVLSTSMSVGGQHVVLENFEANEMVIGEIYLSKYAASVPTVTVG